MSNKNNEGHFGGKVGKGNPPKDSQFTKGQSGNPRGRPPKSKSTNVISAFQKEFLERKFVTVNGKEEYLANIELFFKKLGIDTLKDGNAKEKRIFVDIMRTFKISDRFIDEEDIDFEPILNDPQYYDPDGELSKEDDDDDDI